MRGALEYINITAAHTDTAQFVTSGKEGEYRATLKKHHNVENGRIKREREMSPRGERGSDKVRKILYF